VIRRKRRAALLAVAGEGDRSGKVLTSRCPSCRHQGLAGTASRRGWPALRRNPACRMG
jgi:hypothetical protein